jgi:hypothetical protein
MQFTIKDGEVVYNSEAVDPNNPTAQEKQAVIDFIAGDQAKEQALASIYAPVEYNGKLYPADAGSMAKYEMAKQSKGRGKTTKGIAIAVDGSVLKLSTPAEIDAFHGAIEDAVVARLSAVHDAL